MTLHDIILKALEGGPVTVNAGTPRPPRGADLRERKCTMNRLQQRLAHIERAILPAGRMCAVTDDGSEDIEARIARCRAETGLSDRDLVVDHQALLRASPRGGSGAALDDAAAAQGSEPSAGSYGPQKGFANVLPHPRSHRQA